MVSGSTAVKTLLITLLVTLSACDRSEEAAEELRKQGEVVVLTRNAPTTHYLRNGHPRGPEHDLASAFAEWVGVKARFVVLDGVGEVLGALAEGRGDLAAAGLTATARRKRDVLFGPAYQTVRQEVVCHRRGPVPENAKDLSDVDLLVVAGTSYVERLEDLRNDVPDLEWRVTDALSTEEVLRKVQRKQVDCTVADSNVIALNQRYFPGLAVAFPLSAEQPLAWAFQGDDRPLRDLAKRWFHEQSGEDGFIAVVRERYYAHTESYDPVNLREFRNHIQTRLPGLRSFFEEAAARHGIEWRLLAALAYQESYWNPDARSPTGVRGIMMLTRTTAEHLGVEDRLDPKQSIFAGARYLARLRDRLPDEIEEPDRMWSALAAYNLGYGHLKDARQLAAELGEDPDHWKDLKTVLPLLARKQHYEDLPHGYARGTEPVRMVRRIRNFRDVLRREVPDEN